MQKLLKPLQSQLVLPADWELADQLSEQLDLHGVGMRLAGMAAKRQSWLVTGSAASWTHDPQPFAYYELLERMAIVEAFESRKPKRLIDPYTGKTRAHCQDIFLVSPQAEFWQAAKSNGVALGSSWLQAATHALWESVERHLVLVSWLGASIPEKLQAGWPPGLQNLSQHYRLEHYSFASLRSDFSVAPIWATGTFLWPLNEDAPVIYGFAGAATRDEAVQRSLREAMQRLGFLDGSEPAAAEPSFSPSPDYHQEYFLHPSRKSLLRDWLAGAFYQKQLGELMGQSINPVQFVDLTPPGLNEYRVVKALTPTLLPLWFGHYQPAQFPKIAAERRIHPIV